MSNAAIAAAFDKWAKEGAGPRMEDAHAATGRKVLDRLTIGYDEAFIDLGCGTGWAARYIAEKIPVIGLCVGVDVSPQLIAEARRLAAGKVPVKFLVAPIEEVPFGEASFHHAFSMESLYYAADPAAALKAVWRILKPGGTFHLVIDYYAENPLSAAWQGDIPVKMAYLSQGEWTKLFEAAGFSEVRAERVFDDRPIPEDLTFPWGGFKTRADLETFRTKIGSLYLSGRKASASSALDRFLDRARQEIRQEGAGEAEERAPAAPGPPRGRFGGKKKRA